MVEQAIKDMLNTVMLVTFLGGLGLAGAYMLSLLLRGLGEAGRGLGEGAGATLRGLGEFLASAGSAVRDLADGLGDFVRGSRSDRDVHRLVDYAPRLRSRERLGALDVGAYLGLAAGVKAVRGVGRRVRRASKRARRAAKRTMRRTLHQVAADARATWRASTSPRWTAEEPPLWEWGVPQEAAEDFMRTLDEAGVPYTAYVAPDGTVRVAVEDPDLAREVAAEAGWVEVEPPTPVAAAPVEVFDPETGEWISYDEDGLTETPVPDPSAGGTALVRKYGREYMREIGRRGGLARWEKKG